MFAQKLRRFLPIATVVGLFLVSDAHAGQTSVDGNLITSRDFPTGSIAVDAAFKYVGSTAFVLYGVANCEIHVFAEHEGKRVKRFYWIQFEGYLPDKKQTYNYAKDPQRTTIGGHAFHERASFTNVEASRASMRPGSDREAVQKLLDDNGYVIGPDVMLMRLVRLDDAARRELMIIYSENLDALSLKASDLAEGGKAFATRDALIDGMRQRAVAGLKMEMK